MHTTVIFSLWYFWLFFWILSLCGYGYVFSRKFLQNWPLDKSVYKVWFYGVAGCILVSSIVIFLNIFIPISFLISLGLLVIGLTGALFWYMYERKEWIKYAGFSAVTSLLIYISVLIFGVKNADTQYYHLHAIDWIVSNPLPFGLANLKMVLGVNTAWFPLGAVVEQPLFLFNYPIFISNAIILTFYGILLVSIIFSSAQRITGKISLTQILLNLKCSEWFFVLSLLPVSIFSYGYIASPSPDYPVFLLTFVVLGVIIYYIEALDVSNGFLLWMATIYAIFAAGIKLSAIMLVPLIFLFICIIFLYGTSVHQLPRKVIQVMYSIPIGYYILSFLAIIPTFIRGFIASGSPIFPKTIPIVHDIFPWSVPHEIARGISQDVLAWARSPGPGYHESLNGYDWIGEWIISVITWQKGILTLFLLFSFVIFICLIYYSMLQQKKAKSALQPDTQNALVWYPFLVIGVGLLFWFFTGPDPRFAGGYLFSLGLFMIIFPYMKYACFIPANMVNWSKIVITIAFAAMTIGTTGYCFMDSFEDEKLLRPIQELEYIPHTVGEEIVYTLNFTEEEVNDVIISRHPLLTAHNFNGDLIIKQNPITGYYHMFRINHN